MQFEETTGPDQESLDARVQRFQKAARDIPGFRFTNELGEALQAIQQEEERDMLSKRSRRGLVDAAKTGRILSGSAPYGYSYDPQTKTRTINPVEAPVVMQMFEMAAEGMTPGEIARSMNSRDILTRSGWPWTEQGVRRILKNETLTGMVQFMGIRIKTVPIIGKALFDLVQRLLGQRRTKITPRLTGMVRCGACERDNAYLLTGILWCGRCGDRMTSTRTKDARCYRCVSNLAPDCNARCNTHSSNAAVLENKVWNYAKDLLRDPIGTVEAIQPITQKEEQRITDWCRRTAPLLDGMDNTEKREVLRILGVGVTVEDSSESIQIRLKPHLNPDGDGDGDGDETPPATS